MRTQQKTACPSTRADSMEQRMLPKFRLVTFGNKNSPGNGRISIGLILGDEMVYWNHW
jgi:hypothetical protein